MCCGFLLIRANSTTWKTSWCMNPSPVLKKRASISVRSITLGATRVDSTPQAQRQRVERCGVNRAATYRLIFTGRGCVEQGHVDVFTSNESCTQSMKPNGVRNRPVSRRMCSSDCLAQDGSGLGTEFGPMGTRGGPASGYGLWSSFWDISVQQGGRKKKEEEEDGPSVARQLTRGSSTKLTRGSRCGPAFGDGLQPRLLGRGLARMNNLWAELGSKR